MTTDRTTEDINEAYVGLDRPRRLVKPHPRQVCNEIGLEWNTALVLGDRGWLGFHPDAKSELEEHEVAELRFVGSLVACGMDENGLGRALHGLRRPYRYRIERMYFDWLAKKWHLLPSVPVLDEIEDIIDALQREGEIEVLESLYEQIAGALDINRSDYRKKIIAGIAASECKKISGRIIDDFERMTEGMSSGDDSSLKSIWDEICVQVQGEESVFWGAYSEMIRVAIHFEVEKLDAAIKQAIWLQTNEGIDWEIDNEGHETATFYEDDIKNHVEKIVLSAAADWTNEGIEKYLEREYDDPNIGNHTRQFGAYQQSSSDGKAGRTVKSERKATSSAANGLKGGKPRKKTQGDLNAISNAASAMGRKGGLVTSERKAASSRENGLRGGRPRKAAAAENEGTP